MFKVMYDQEYNPITQGQTSAEHWRGYSIQDFRVLKDLILLLEESDTSPPSNVPSDKSTTTDEKYPQPKDFKSRSRKFPALQGNSNIWAFLQKVTHDLEELNIGTKKLSNLTMDQARALESLQNRKDLVIKPADKGGNVVVLSKDKYVSMCLRILSNREWYVEIDKTKIKEFKVQFDNILYGAYDKDLITKQTLDYLNVKFPRLPTFYALPKMHKDLTNPPGRPIVSGMGSQTERASRLVDDYLRTHVTSLPSYIQDTSDLLRRLDGMCVPCGAWLVAIDVEALYSSIPHVAGVQVIREFLDERPLQHQPYSEFVVALLEHVLTTNVFTFNDTIYHQIQGVAMGTCCAPTYANLYLGGWERSLMADERFSHLSSRILAWYRFIDDVLMIWGGSRGELLEFVNSLGINSYNLKFTTQFDQSEITFLDVRVIIDNERLIRTTLYRKETAGNTILRANSQHPRPLINSIPYSQYLRLKRNCTREEDFSREAKLLRSRLLKRGYSKSCLRRAFNRAQTKNRHDLLFERKEKTNDSQTVKFVTTYMQQHKDLRQILGRHWHLLAEHRIISKYVRPFPEVVYRRARSMRDRVVRSHFVSDSDSCFGALAGTFKCGECNQCSRIYECQEIILPNGHKFKPKYHVTCATTGIIYLMTCTCGAYYVGKTIRAFRTRIQDHIYYITSGQLTSPIGRHVGLHHRYNPDNIRFMALDHIEVDQRGGDRDKRLLQSETRWIYYLKATKSPGLNEAVSFKSFLPD